MSPRQSSLDAFVGALGQRPHPGRKGGPGSDANNVDGEGDPGVRAEGKQNMKERLGYERDGKEKLEKEKEVHGSVEGREKTPKEYRICKSGGNRLIWGQQ